MAAARKKTKTKARKAQAKRGSKGGSKAKKTAIKRPKRDREAKAPLAEMDAAWQSLLETAIERRRAEHAQAKPRTRAAKK